MIVSKLLFQDENQIYGAVAGMILGSLKCIHQPQENPAAYLSFHNKIVLIRKMLINMSLLSNVHASFLFLISLEEGIKKELTLFWGICGIQLQSCKLTDLIYSNLG